MNPRLDTLHPYPFEKLRTLFSGVQPPDIKAIRLSIGEPQHPTPELIKRALVESLDGLATYPSTIGVEALRVTISHWLKKRFSLKSVDAATQVLPVCGTREALFSFAQSVVDTSRPSPLVVCPNPFYQIYEGAALLAGAQPVFMNQTPENGFRFDPEALRPDEWARVQLIYVCSPGNPTGRTMTLEEWKTLFELSDKYGFVIASDECYSEIYFDEDSPPFGGLEAAERLGRSGFPRLVAFSSLSKRSSVPGLRSGFVAGDAAVIGQFLKYRTYHGCAMSVAVQKASVAAWEDESHVAENRALYREKFDAVIPLLGTALDVQKPDASFYLWARTPGSDTDFARKLYQHTNVTVLPGQFLARHAHGRNPGEGFVRIALVATLDECVEAANRIAQFTF